MNPYEPENFTAAPPQSLDAEQVAFEGEEPALSPPVPISSAASVPAEGRKTDDDYEIGAADAPPVDLPVVADSTRKKANGQSG